jgi:hypothetical protein
VAMDPNSLKGKIWFNVIDKIFIGTIALIILLIFQHMAYQYQERQNAGVAVGKIYTGIILKQREDIIDLMGKYFLFLEQIKTEGKGLTIKQKKVLKDYLNKTRFILDTLCAISPKALQGTQKGKELDLKKITGKFLGEVSSMNVFLLGVKPKDEIPLKEFERRSDQIREQYINLLDELREVSIKTVRQEIDTAG